MKSQPFHTKITPARLVITICILAGLTSNSVAQVPNIQDCLGAMPLCITSYANANIYTGTGNISNEINPANSCLLTGERNDVWYILTTSSSGNLAFTITPTNPAHNYDWAVFDLTSAKCSDIFSNPSLQVACNYSNLPGNTGANGLAGAQNSPVIPVNAGQTYLINISGFSSVQQAGYTLDLSASTATIADNTPPSISSVTTMNCGASSLTLSFSERVRCSTVSASDFTITGPGGPFTVTAVNSQECTQGATYSRDYTLSFSPSIPGAGTYTISLVNPVTDLCNNVATTPQAFPIQISGVNIAFQKTDVTCFGGNNGSATAIVTGAPGPYTYQWSPSGGNGQSASFLIAGTYSVTVTSASGCTGQASVTIGQPLTGLTASASITPASGCAANGSATVTVSNGQAPFTYSWWPSGGNAATANNLASGSYLVTITDVNQCVLNYFLNVTSSAGPTAVISNTTDVTCHGGNDGSATVTVNGASGPFTYQWSPSGGNAATASNLTAGNYSVVVTISASCTLSASAVIVEPPTDLNPSVSAFNTSCGNNNGSIGISTSGGVPPYNYVWSPNVSSGPSAPNLSAGTYTITITDANGCSKVKTAVINPSTQPVANLAGHSDVTCNGQNNGTTGVTVTGGLTPYTYNWSSGQTTASLSNIGPGIYTVTVTDAAGCTSTVTDNISEPPAIQLNLVSSQNISCYGDSTGSIQMSGSGGTGTINWQWTGNTSTSASATNLTAGNYTVTITDQSGCSASMPVTISQPAAAISISGNVTPTSCGNSDGTITTSVTGGTGTYTYSWSNGATTSTLSNLPPGIYTITVTDNNGCNTNSSFTIQASNAPLISVVSVIDVTCNGQNTGSATLNAVGGVTPYTWSWSGGVSTGPSASALGAGNYTITVTDNTGCQAFQSVTVNQPDALVLQVSAPVTICQTGSTTLSASVSGGTQPYTYSWSNSATSAQVTVTPGTTTSYNYSITDGNGCQSTSPMVAVNVLPALSLNVSYPDSVCEGSTANLVATGNGGDGNYSYHWSNGNNNASQSLVIQQNTALTVTLTDGCNTPSVSQAVSITAVSAPSLSFTLPQQAGCEPLETNFAIPGGPMPGLSYMWDFGDGLFSQQPNCSHTYLNGGLYSVALVATSSAAGACSTTLQFPQAVNVYTAPVARFIFDPPVPTLNHPEVFFTDRSTGASEWLWEFGDHASRSTDQNPRFTYSDTGAYLVSLTVKSLDGCEDTTKEIVPVKDEIQVFIPNAFTPDESGVNDVFKIYGVGFTSYEIEIYDRWGKLIHKGKNKEEAWDGKSDSTGDPVPQGMYIYKVIITDNNGNMQTRFSNVTLIR